MNRHGLRAMLHRTAGWIRRSRSDADLREEIRTHLVFAEDDARRRGASAEEAPRLARLRSGGEVHALEALREQRGLPWLDECGRDLRYGLRLLRRSPLFTAMAVLTLALGMGVNGAVYQLLDAVRFRSLPVAGAEQLTIVELADMSIWKGRRTTGYPSLTYALWEQLRDDDTAFEDVLAWSSGTVRVDGTTAVRSLFVSGEYFNVLGVRPLLGRVFTAADDRPGCGASVAVISYAFWRRHLGGSPAALGARLQLNSQPVQVVGVTPPGFFGVEVGRTFDVAVPICSHAVLGGERGWLADRNTWWLTVMARRAAGQSLDQISASLAARSPAWFDAAMPPNLPADDVRLFRAQRLRAVDGRGGVSVLRARYTDPLIALLLTAVMVLLVGVTNLANLVLARASAREREFAVRLALGASWRRLVQQLAVEHALLAGCGAIVGLAVATLFSRTLVAFLGAGFSLELGVDWRLVVFMATLAIAVCVVFALMPARRVARLAIGDTIKASARTLTGGRAARVRQVLVAGQVAVSLVLLVGALLFTSTLRNLTAVDPGFDPAAVATVRIDLSGVPLSANARVAVANELQESLNALPGVVAAAHVRHVPLGGTGSSMEVWRDDQSAASRVTVRANAVGDRYLDVIGVTPMAGRGFSSGDFRFASRAVIVNRTFVRRLGLPDNPVGQQLHTAVDGPERQRVYDIVGVIPDAKYFSLREDDLPVILLPFEPANDPRPFTDVMVRTAVPVPDIASSIQQAAMRVHPSAAADVRAFDDLIRATLLRERLMAVLSSVFGALAAVIAALGLYAVMSYSVAQRTNEIGVRLALGAARFEILGMILRDGAVLVAIGLVIGTLLTLALAGSAEALVFGLRPDDPMPIALAAALLTVIGLAASWFPAWRAARLSPVTALRRE